MLIPEEHPGEGTLPEWSMRLNQALKPMYRFFSSSGFLIPQYVFFITTNFFGEVFIFFLKKINLESTIRCLYY